MAAAGIEPRRWGNEIAVSTPTNSYACTDGHVYLGVILDTHWQRLCELLGRPELALAPGFATNLERLDNRGAVDSLVAGWCRQRSAADVVRQLTEAGIVVAPVNDYRAAITDPHVRERDMLQSVEMVDGVRVEITGPAAKFSRTPTRVRHGAPLPNAHTDEVLGEVLTHEQLAALRSAGAIG
jgi:formyl-CoA transferase